MEAIAEIASLAGFSLPEDYVAFLRQTNAVYGLSVHNGYCIGPLARERAEWSPRTVGDEPATVVATDGGGNSFLMTTDGRVWRRKLETGAVDEVARSFDSFLRKVVREWEAYTNGEAGWRYLT